jgi:hypothetical protein
LRITSTAYADPDVNVTQLSSIQEENQPSGALTARIKPYRGQLRNEFLAGGALAFVPASAYS